MLLLGHAMQQRVKQIQKSPFCLTCGDSQRLYIFTHHLFISCISISHLFIVK